MGKKQERLIRQSRTADGQTAYFSLSCENLLSVSWGGREERFDLSGQERERVLFFLEEALASQTEPCMFRELLEEFFA